ncbi:MAG: NYN domain-containing protein [Candidatus Sungbacteria bacterium]|nr:NYN domain-containing protein [Candidatus Sungbacteria bacterium]
MLHQFIKGRVYVFIDAENVFYAQRTLGWKISYEKLLQYFKRECGERAKYINLRKIKDEIVQEQD